MEFTFEELRDSFQSRGYHKQPLCLDGLSPKHQRVTLDILRALVRERDELAEVQTRLLAKNQELSRNVHTADRRIKEAEEKTQSVHSRVQTLNTRLRSADQALRDEQAAHKLTREQLIRARKENQQIKAAAVQHRAVTDRNAERLRDKVASLSMSNLKSLVPDIRIASPAFMAKAGSLPSESLTEQQLINSEQKNAALIETSHALKKLAVDAMNTLYEADIRLHKIVKVELEHEKSTSRSRQYDSDSAISTARLFPPLRPLVTQDTDETHPARQKLTALSRAIQDHVAQLSQWAAINRVRWGKKGDIAWDSHTEVDQELEEVEDQLQAIQSSSSGDQVTDKEADSPMGRADELKRRRTSDA
ncbi:hypothetical protein MYAM1_002904 [Malassezia yamatoensis]|uniref:Afadin and alpha-actinin-binding-domain-containing protein n=1 Tax=Malassezia yamatoensis TaxID=253288 RepID=A0AAJ5YUU4_9BASI|nr:hypothetical protein MYAM1_002904 [Malassezia yamatoensis]